MKTISSLFFLLNVFYALAQNKTVLNPSVASCILGSISKTDVTCNGGTNGTATVYPTNGIGPYLFAWNTSPIQTSQTATNLSAGTYVVKVDDQSCYPSGIELINNGNFESGSVGFSSDYVYSTTNNSEGYYNTINGNFITAWHPSFYPIPDHTSGSGNILAVNGSSIAGQSVFCQNITVNQNTTYNFSTWIASVYPFNPASLQFYINGIPLGSIFNAPVSTGVWNQFFSVWNSGGNTSANICVVNQNLASGGNDFALDDISFRECITPCPVTVTVTIDQPPAITASAGGVVTCSTTNVTLTGTGGTSYNWTGPAIISGATTANPIVNAGGTYNVTVTDGNGCSANTSVIVSQNNTPPSPSASVGGNLTCATTNMTLTGSGGGSYSWTGPSIVSGGTTANPVVNQPGTYSLTVVNASNGCSALTTVFVNQNITIPSFVLGTVSTLSTTCAYPTVTLIASSNADPNTTYTWLTPVSTTLNGSTVTSSSIGVYTVYVTNTINGCNSAATINTVEVVADSNLPIVTLSTNNPIITCANTTTNVTASVNVSSVNYSWNPTTGIISGATTNNPTFDTPGTYSLIVTNTVNSCATAAGNNIVTVISNTILPVITLSSGLNLDSITCSNPFVMLTPTITPNANLTYTWSPSSGLSTNPYQANATFTTSGIYQLAVTNTLTGCMSLVNSNSNYTVVLNTDTPTITVVPTSSNIIVGCGTNASVMYSVTASSTSGNNSYNWQPTGSVLATNTVVTAGSQTITVTDNVSGCKTTTVFTVISNITVPTINAVSSALFPCDGNTTSLTASSTNSNVSFNWQGTSIVSGANTNSVTIGSIGIYTLTLMDNITNCTSSQIIPVSIDTVMAWFTANPNTGIAPLLVDFTNTTISSNTVNTTYEWTFGDGNNSTVINPSNTFNLHGTYTISLVATLGVCTDTAYSILIVNEDVTLIIPNFFTPDGNGQNDVFSIHGIEKYPNNTIEIYNRWGALVYLKKGYNNTFDGKANQPSMGNGLLPSNTYFFVLHLGDGISLDYTGYLELKY